MPKRGENIYKRKDNRWEGRYYALQPDGGRKLFSVYAKSYGAVKEKLLACKEKARQNIASLPDCKMTAEKLFLQWLSCKADRVKISTYRQYENIIRNHLLPDLGQRRIDRLTAKNISDFILQKHKSLAAKTVADILFVIKAALKMAAQEYNLPQLTGILELKAPAKGQKCIETFTPQEIKILSQHILAQPLPQNMAVLLALSCGLRLGEVCALEWPDIDLTAQTLSVKRNVQRLTINGKSQLMIQTPKSECSRRIIPLTAEMVALLHRLKKNNPGKFVFGGTRPLEPRTLQYRFAALLKNCGIRYRNFHTLRHTFASRYIEVGADVKSLSEILGHARVNITMQLYVHPSMEQKRYNMEAISFLHGLGA